MFHPNNIPEVEDRIQKNAEDSEKEELLKSLFNDPITESVIDEEMLKLLKNHNS